MVMEETHVPNDVGSNSGTIYWMDFLSHIFVVKICNVCLKRLKINEKEAGVGPFCRNNSIFCSIYKMYLHNNT